MTEDALRIFIVARVMSRIARPGDKRTEALRELLGVVLPDMDVAAINELAATTPEIPQSYYERWAGMFADRILETVPHEQITDLCANTEESNATLFLLYSMFMESEKMETILAQDIQALFFPAAEQETTQ